VKTLKKLVHDDVAVQSDGTIRNDMAVPYNGVAHNLFVDNAAELLE